MNSPPSPLLSTLLSHPPTELIDCVRSLDLQTFCDLIEILGKAADPLRYPIFHHFVITQTYEGKYQTEMGSQVVTFTETTLEHFDLREGLSVYTDSVWGIPRNMNAVRRLPGTSFVLYANITRQEPFKSRDEYFREFDSIYIQLTDLDNHNMTFDDLMNLLRHAKNLSISVKNLPSNLAKNILVCTRYCTLDHFHLGEVPEDSDIETLGKFIKERCSSPSKATIEFKVSDVNAFRLRVTLLRIRSPKDYSFGIIANGQLL